MRVRIDCCGKTDIGKFREQNEDHFLIADLSKSLHIEHTSLDVDGQKLLLGGSRGKLLLVADGIGGSTSGERASELAIESMAQYLLNALHWLRPTEEERLDEFMAGLRSAVEYCHDGILAEIDAHPENQGMGTSLTMAYIIWPRLFVVHAGDSRCYLLHEKKLTQITTDQTFAQSLVEHGILSPDKLEASPFSHVLWSAIGGESAQLEAVVCVRELDVGDVLLVCSDGVTRHLSCTEIAAELQAGASAQATCQRMIDMANERGGIDNITAVVAKFFRCGE